MTEYRYKTGLNILELLIEPDAPEPLDSFDVLQGRLLRHLDEYHKYGGSDSDINRDLGALNKLAREVSDHSFNSLCVAQREIEKRLKELLDKMPSVQARQLAARIVYNKNQISDDKNFLQSLLERYHLPQPENKLESTAYDIGPDIQWHGPEDEIQLQSFFQAAPEMLDMGLLKKAVEYSNRICLITLPALNRSATGFLLAPGKILTNYHVLKSSAQESLEHNAREAKLSFGYMTNNHGTVPPCFHLNPSQPILSQSPPEQLDYVLLQMEENAGIAPDLQAINYSLTLPIKGSGLYILLKI